MSPSARLVVCIGNELVADDAVGYRVYRTLRETMLPPGVRLEYCGVGGVALLELLTGDEELLVVVDAVQFGAAPGTLHCLPWDRLPELPGQAVSAHGIGLKETIVIGRTLYPERLPERVLLLGVEGRCFDRLGEEMTPAVAAAVPAAVELLLKELHHGEAGGQA